MKIEFIKKRFWAFGLVVGFVSAFTITLVIVIWEWLENPSGIFHNDNGTNWSFVYDTAVSWFIPTFIQITLLAAILHLLVSAIKRYKRSA